MLHKKPDLESINGKDSKKFLCLNTPRNIQNTRNERLEIQ